MAKSAEQELKELRARVRRLEGSSATRLSPMPAAKCSGSGSKTVSLVLQSTSRRILATTTAWAPRTAWRMTSASRSRDNGTVKTRTGNDNCTTM
jgi:hypothetical protein